jgi:hypothetical protein
MYDSRGYYLYQYVSNAALFRNDRKCIDDDGNTKSHGSSVALTTSISTLADRQAS